MESATSWAQVGDRVRRARQALGYSQTGLAQRVSVDRTALVKIESGARSVSALELNRLADVLALPIAYFVTREPEAVTTYRAAVADAPPQSDSPVERSRFLIDAELEQHARDAKWLFEQGFLIPPTPLTVGRIETQDDAENLARGARQHIGIGVDPVGSMATAAEKLGLYIKVVPVGTGGASLHLDDGFGVAVVGSESLPGRRRTTAAHELGHHLWGDPYNTDVGVSASDNEKERLVDTFAASFLLPDAVLARNVDPDHSDALRRSLIQVAAEYRVSWTVAVLRARRVYDLTEGAYRRLAAATPLRGDFLEVVGYEPRYDLAATSTGPRWRRAVLAAYKNRAISPWRTVELVNGSLTVDDLPSVDGDIEP